MSKETPVILLINSPQNSKTSQLREIDLLVNPDYRNIVHAFDQALKTSPADSLNPVRQCASVVHSVASFGAFANGLKEALYPGSIYPSVDFRFMGHSVGEMASFVEAGILDIPTVAQLLTQRQLISEDPLGTGIKFMLAAAGLDLGRCEAFLGQIKEQFQGKVEAVVANSNTQSDVVLSVKVDEDVQGLDRKTLANRLSLLDEFKHTSAERLRIICLPLVNAFHSYFMKAEEGLFIASTGSIIESQTGRVIPGMIYSPMMPGWVDTREQAIDINKHQLTSSVNFVQAMQDALQIPGLIAIITADVKDITPKMVKGNLADEVQVPIYNIKDTATLLKAINDCTGLYRR